MNFKDHFSGHARSYERFRPQYPESLFEFLSKLPRSRDLCWDCGTGNGQAASGLAAHFARVVATDASEQQISLAQGPANVEFRVAPAEESGLEGGTADLITVAQALHWFDFDRFFTEVRRVARKGGVLAVWGYQLTRVSAEIDARIRTYYDEEIGRFWAPERKLVDEGYGSLSFPGEELEAPSMDLTAQWSREDFIGYLGTWSATQKAIRSGEKKLFERLQEDLEGLWSEDEVRTVSWPLFLRVFRLSE